jgi:hypothetical protein
MGENGASARHQMASYVDLRQRAPVDGGRRCACSRWTPSNKRQVGDLLLPFCGEAWLLLAGRGDREMPVAASLHLVGTQIFCEERAARA